jgi:threonylcarbamoyladenosine tRNA methylthiotransferase MtaB
VVFGADIIAGFPTETEEMFENSLKIVDDCGLTHLHIFPFSPRPGTPAARMPQLPRQVIKERGARLRAKGEEALVRYLSAEVGKIRPVLLEHEDIGRTEQYTPVELAGFEAGEIVETRIIGHTGRHLLGEALCRAA